MKIITIIGKNNNDQLARQFAQVMFENKQFVELVLPRDDIMGKYNIKSLPAAILESEKVIYEDEMRSIIMKLKNAGSIHSI